MLLYLPIFVASLFIYSFKDPKTFQGVYACALAAMIIINQHNFWYAIIFGALGVLAHFLAIGFFGEKLHISEYITLQIIVGLYPWAYVNISSTIIYVCLFLLIYFFMVYRSKYSVPSAFLQKKRKTVVSVVDSRIPVFFAILGSFIVNGVGSFG